MNASERMRELKKYLSGQDHGLTQAEADEVTAEVSPAYDSNTGRVALNAVMSAHGPIRIENYGASILCVQKGGKGSSAVGASCRGWGVAEGPEIAAGIDVAVAGSGDYTLKWRVGTFVRTSGGYRLWTAEGQLDFRA